NSVLRDTLRKRKSRKNESHEQRLEEFKANLTDDSNKDFQSEIDVDMNEPNILLPLPFTILEEFDKCPTCKEFPSITLVVGECRRCYNKKTLPKKFSFDNNMDPGEVPEELQELTEIEEMLIAQVFSVVVVYRLHVEEFTTRLPWHPSSLNMLIICQQSDKDPIAFRDFKIRRNKVAHILHWLKVNNNYYSEITINNENLQSLPEDGFIDDQLQINQLIDDEFNKDNEENIITHTF
ncbi:20338_t:CDS:2, partial [Gigaspora rosea]